MSTTKLALGAAFALGMWSGCTDGEISDGATPGGTGAAGHDVYTWFLGFTHEP